MTGTTNNSVSGVRYSGDKNKAGSKKQSQVACGFVSYRGKKYPFTAITEAASSDWEIIFGKKKLNALKNGGVSGSTSFAVYQTCAQRYKIPIGRWSGFVKSSPAKVSGGRFGLTAAQRSLAEKEMLQALRKKGLSHAGHVKILSFASKKHKGSIRFGCGYAKVGSLTIPFRAFHVLKVKKGKKSFHVMLSNRSSFGKPASFQATIADCRSEGFRMHSAL